MIIDLLNRNGEAACSTSTIVSLEDAAEQLEQLIDFAIAGQNVLIAVSPEYYVRLLPLVQTEYGRSV